MTRTRFSLEVFGDRIPISGLYDGDTNSKNLNAMKKALSKAIETELTDCQREIVNEYYFGGATVTEIAKRRGVSKSTVSRHLSRSRERLKSALKYGIYTMWNNI